MARRRALRYVPRAPLIVWSDGGFGRQAGNREIAFHQATAIAQRCNLVRRDLGLPTRKVPATDPRLQVDVVQTHPRRRRGGGPATAEATPLTPRAENPPRATFVFGR